MGSFLKACCRSIRRRSPGSCPASRGLDRGWERIANLNLTALEGPALETERARRPGVGSVTVPPRLGTQLTPAPSQLTLPRRSRRWMKLLDAFDRFLVYLEH